MPTIPHPSRGVTKCNRCGAPIRWATWGEGPQRGQRVPLNALPSPAGGLAAHTNGPGGLIVRQLDKERPEPELLEWALLHWNSCTGGNNSQQQAPRSRPARRRPTVQPPLWGQQTGRWGR
ncbi:hypothetical protein [Streptomyces sp. NPDC048385]|uniref:hypothetical protein n=1 Tax=Streptomyces sp. NPDC048385 TaxID=3155145 RepID=UPI00341B6E8D